MVHKLIKYPSNTGPKTGYIKIHIMRKTPIKRKQPLLDDILKKLREHLPELRKRYHVKSLGVFGSYVHGEQRRRSDVDILVEFEQVPTLFGYVELQERLGKILEVKVDLVMKSALKPAIGKRILEEVVPV